MKYFKPAILNILLLASSFYASAQQPVASIDKNKDYLNACRWLQENGWIRDSLTARHIPSREAIAIVFPELMRYSALEDKMEVTGLMVLYTHLGKDYADFSVGRFQMKPSFIQALETDAKKYLTENEIRQTAPFLLHGEDTRYAREMRVESLTNVKDEAAYLALFYKICIKRFKHLHFKDPEERIRFLATAYNTGYHHSAGTLFRQMRQKQFPVYNGLLVYHTNYADLALEWWKDTSRSPASWQAGIRVSLAGNVKAEDLPGKISFQDPSTIK